MKALLIVLVLFLGLGILVDRIAVEVAEGQVADQLAERAELRGSPEVEIAGFPFLTQAVGGRYDEVEIALTADELGQPAGTRADVVLRGVQVPLSAALSGSVQQVPVERIDGTATLSYELLSAEFGPGTTLTRDGEGMRITSSVELLGEAVPVSAAGTMALDGSDVVFDVERATGAGVDLPDWLLGQAAALLDLRYTVPPLPFGLELTGISAAEDGVEVTVESTGTVIGG